ncbi:VH1-interacting kinase [Perilla frutescens var. hirtella]|uniref:non-specific serine/threonine protein kinase n=1 Tax=Perilla frutescens var. hirtella TaxID=608512 RepID=A0AAD4IMR5_PERFH|nr:VH1-interacting kinase [Perilla frutescens var. hirtella]KAH6771152.1 VH1-interacting kinase [Perilla frutescens var. hirtella]KAH6815258.1 VH1-interacting kinase [Perilla frutescens var. frutescens]
MSGSSGSSGAGAPADMEKKKEKARVSRTSLILWHAHQNDVAAVRKLLEEDRSLVNARDYDNRTPLHVAAIHGWIDVAKCLLEYEADVNAQDRWKNTPLADAEGAKRSRVIVLLKSYGGLSYGQSGSHFEPRPVAPPLPNKCDWEIEPSELDFSTSTLIGKGSFGEILKAGWRGTPVAVKRILPNLSDDKLVIQDFRHEVNLLVKLRHPNIVQFLGAVTERKPLMLVTEYLRGGDLHQHLKGKGALSPSTAINFALDIARGMAYLHSEPNVIIHRDLKPRNVLLVNTSADHLKVGDFGLSKLIKVQHSHDVYKLTGETGSYRYMAPEVFKHRKYDKKVDVYSFAMILYEMLEGEPPMSNYEPYEAAKYVADGHRPMCKAKGYSPELRELTEQCWAPDMTHRPSFLDILKRLEKIKESLPSDHHWHLFSSKSES